VLRDLAETTLEAQIVKVFVQKISELPLEETPAWPEGSTGQLTVSSAFTLTDGQRATITKAVRQRWGEAVVPRFQTAPEEIGGIELAAGGYKLAWTIAEYLSGLEKRVAELAEALPETKATPTKKEHVN
ncbi:MAG: F0F1 ATP synthase subunit delta, partial [Lewinella sp.]|nr:F0F1 ATP synthase subunit delta [Lewinella sp.]